MCHPVKTMDAATLDDPADMELQRMTREDYVHKLEQEGLRVSARSTVDLTMHAKKRHAEKGMRAKTFEKPNPVLKTCKFVTLGTAVHPNHRTCAAPSRRRWRTGAPPIHVCRGANDRKDRLPAAEQDRLGCRLAVRGQETTGARRPACEPLAPPSYALVPVACALLPATAAGR